MFRRTGLGSKFDVERKNRWSILEMFHDQIGRWDRETTKQFIIARFWWTSAGSNVTTFFEAVRASRRPSPFKVPSQVEDSANWIVPDVLDGLCWPNTAEQHW